MPCSKKDYVAVAMMIAAKRNAIRFTNQGPDHGRGAVGMLDAIMLDLSNYFASQSSAYDRERFLDACGFNNDEPKRYRVGGKRGTYSFEDAKARAEKIFKDSGVVVSIEEAK